MKHLIYIIYAAMLAFGLAACSDSDTIGMGYLVLGDVTLGEADVVAVGTRAVDADLCIEIVDAGDAVVQALNGSDANGKIELLPGEYRLRAFTPNVNTVYSDTEQGEGKYRGEQAFTISDERVTYVSLAVPMVNAAVSLSLPEGFGGWFTAYTFTVSYGDRTIAIADGDKAYFDVDGTEASYTLTAVNTDGEEMTSNGTFAVQPGRCYTVTYQLETHSVRVVY